MNKASLHGVSHVLDANFVPAPGAETENFDMMKQFVKAVFIGKIKHSEAANIVQKFPDAQLCTNNWYNGTKTRPKPPRNDNYYAES